MYISPYCRQAPIPPNFMQFSVRCWLIDIITRVKFVVNRFRGYGVLTPPPQKKKEKKEAISHWLAASPLQQCTHFRATLRNKFPSRESEIHSNAICILKVTHEFRVYLFDLKQALQCSRSYGSCIFCRWLISCLRNTLNESSATIVHSWTRPVFQSGN